MKQTIVTTPRLIKGTRNMSIDLPRKAPLSQSVRHLYLHFWGTRGSIPVSGANYVRYGGNTSCVSLTSDTGHLFIFDCGSGLRELGNELMANQHGELAGYILISHTHWDHIQGFPFFGPVFRPGNRFQVIGWGGDEAQDLSEIMAGQMKEHYFPVGLASLPSELNFFSLRDFPGITAGIPIDLDGAKLTTQHLKHPLPSLGYRLEIAGRVLVYATDQEPTKAPTPAMLETGKLLGDDIIDPKVVELARGADVLIHDAQYSIEELNEKIGWGHNAAEIAVDTAIKAGVKRLILYHHDPSHDDAAIDRQIMTARKRAAAVGRPHLEIIAAGDGLELDLF